ncbi:MAG: phosphoadenylyl-sulfate reductase [Aquimonas sp.]|nr:phosphoadenylyl-sulfate reductase [Aquimonas sp.]
MSAQTSRISGAPADLDALVAAATDDDGVALARLNEWLEGLDADARIRFGLEHLPGDHALSSSFGAQAALSLHLLTRHAPGLPVVVVDTGYLFAETYRFIDALTDRLRLKLHIERSARSPAWIEARHGRLWEQGLEGIERYNRIHKTEPMQRALRELGIGTWFAGLRRAQSQSRSNTPVLQRREGRFKLHPIIDWSDREVGNYLAQHALPYHPLWEQGYVSIGDTHTTRPLLDGMREEDTRFFGLKRECGLHE